MNEVANCDGVVNKLPDDRRIDFNAIKKVKITYICPECSRATSNDFDVVKHKIVIDCEHCSYEQIAKVVIDIKPSTR